MHVPEIETKPTVKLVVIDSLRWDTSQVAQTPNLDALFMKHGAQWIKSYAQGTYTLPSHIALFQGGHIPLNNLDPDAPPLLRYGGDKTMFRVNLNWTRNKKSHFAVPESENLVKGFEALGYRTVGVGGVHWFDSRFKTSCDLWTQFFSEFYWHPEFSEEHIDGLLNQIAFVESLALSKDNSPLFFFINISSTHVPCRDDCSFEGQVNALEYVDENLPKLFNALPSSGFTLIMSDHGTLFGEDGLYHHGFYHPKVMEIPMAYFTVE